MKSSCCSVAAKTLLIAAVLLLLREDALAARSGSSRSSSRGSYSSSSSRYTSSSYSRSRSGTSYSRMSTFVYLGFPWSVKYRAFRYGYYLNSLTWRQSHSDLSADTNICFNIQDALPSEYNSSVQVPWIYQNRTTYGIFVCPLDGRSDKTYCCGGDGAEWCCTFWDDSSRVAGIVITCIVTLLVMVIVIIKIIKCGSCSPSSCPNSVSDTVIVTSDTNASSSRGGDRNQKVADDLPPPYPGHHLALNDGANFSNLHGNSYYGNAEYRSDGEEWMKPPPLPQHPAGVDSRGPP